MYPTAVLGLALLVVAVRYARRPQRRLLPLMASLGLVTLLAGALGFVTGVIATLSAAAAGGFQAPPHVVAMEGVAESLHNLALALVISVVAGLAATVGAYRTAHGAPA
jgi:hypothetical protein